jgi:hypothetical protein
MLRVALLAVAAALALPATAQAHWELAADGNPLITTSQYAADQMELFRCPAGEADTAGCSPVVWTDREHRPGDTPPGITFKLRFADGREEQSPPWQGRVQSTAPPTVDGRLFATGDAHPVAGAWTGGWGDDVSRLRLTACRTPAGTECLPLPQVASCPVPCETVPERTPVSLGGQAAIPAALAGRYLIAVEEREPRDQRGWPVPVPALWGLSSPRDVEASSAVRSRSAPVGPLAAPGSAVIVEPALRRSSVTLRTRALRAKGRLSLGRIECLHRCRVSVKVSGGGKRARTTTFVVQGTRAITTPVRRGRLTVRVHVDGELKANGRVRAG